MAEEKALEVKGVVKKAGVEVVTGRPKAEFGGGNDVLCQRWGVDNVESLGCRGRGEVVAALGGLLRFIEETVEADGKGQVHLSRPALYSAEDCLERDEAGVRNLEIVETLRGGKSLRWAVDRAVTAMGKRRVYAWLLRPLKSFDEIMYRQRIVVRLASDERARDGLKKLLAGFADLERLAGRMGGDRASPREVLRLAQSLVKLPELSSKLKELDGTSRELERIVESLEQIEARSDLNASSESLFVLGRIISDVLVDPAPAALASSNFGSAGGEAFDSCRVFRDGYCRKLDDLRASVANPSAWLVALEAKEQKRSGISSLRIKHLKNSGYVVRVARLTAERILEEDVSFFF